MSVYIPGMEMPTRCYTCPCADLEYYDCNLIPGTRIEQHKRLDDCPLVLVPEHGRLIDEKDIVPKDGYIIADGMARIPVKDIVNAPTIIPADHIGYANEMVADMEGEG